MAGIIRGGSNLQFLNNPYGDTTYTKVFVGGLAWETQSETLHRYFQQFGDILEAVVITDKQTGRSKGYGFVTFRDVEAAKRACADPNPVIDGRRANCNLASLGRPQPPLPFGRMRPATPYFGGPHGGPFIGDPSYRQPVPYNYQQFPYPLYGYPPYGPEYVFHQVPYNPYMGQLQQNPQMFGLPGPINTNVFPFGQMGPPPSGSPGHRALQGIVAPGPHVMSYPRPSVSGATTETVPMSPAPYFTGVAPPYFGQMRGAHPSQFTPHHFWNQPSKATQFLTREVLFLLFFLFVFPYFPLLYLVHCTLGTLYNSSVGRWQIEKNPDRCLYFSLSCPRN